MTAHGLPGLLPPLLESLAAAGTCPVLSPPPPHPQSSLGWVARWCIPNGCQQADPQSNRHNILGEFTQN